MITKTDNMLKHISNKALAYRTIADYQSHGYSSFVAADWEIPMVWIEPGEFVIEESDHDSNSVQHCCVLAEDFFLGCTQVTQALWLAVMKEKNPSRFCGLNNPVERVSWYDTQKFLENLNDLCPVEGYRWTLPTEAQWEYACRAGSKSAYCFGDDQLLLSDYAWYLEKTTCPVGCKLPNSWGLYDMHGNVWEWCQDLCFTWGDGRVIRGGSWFTAAQYCRSASRSGRVPGGRYDNVGFRPALAKHRTKREIFLIVKNHLLTQKQRSHSKYGCMYKSDGLSCAVGCLIKDEDYDPAMEDCGIDNPLLVKALEKNRVHCDENVIKLLRVLQTIHDSISPANWKQELSKIETYL